MELRCVWDVCRVPVRGLTPGGKKFPHTDREYYPTRNDEKWEEYRSGFYISFMGWIQMDKIVLMSYG